MSVELRQKAVVIDGVPTFVFSGELISYRLPGALWADRLQKLKAAGLNTVGIYFAWNFHSAAKGAADFAASDRDLAHLLDLAHETGLHVIARPGPYVCNEWDLGGYPAWLLNEDAGDWRSGDPKHLAFCRDWYRQVNAVLAKKQHGAGGSIVLYQIENEHRWNDRPFLGGLCDAARADGIAVPLVGNHDGGGLCVLDKLAEGTDIYTPVFEFCRWRGWLDIMNRRIGPELPLMVLEFRCGEHPLWGQAPVSDEWPPAHWTLSQTRLFMAAGANVVNHFVGAGGITPIGFNSDHIPTSYVDNPPVSPWGELTARFYEMRLLGLFQQSFNRALAESAPVTDAGWGTDDVQVECLVRRSEQATFLFLANHSNQEREFRILLPGDRHLPEAPALRIPPFRTRILLADADLGNGIRLRFSPLQILSYWNDGDGVRLIVYGEPGETGTLEFATGTERATATVTCADTVGTATLQLAGRRVAVHAAATEIAARTWLPKTADGRTLPLFGRVPLMRPQHAAGAPLALELPAADTQVALTVPAESADSLQINGTPAAKRSLRPDGLAEVAFELPALPPARAELGALESCAIDDAWTTNAPAADAGWQPAVPWGENATVLVQPGDYEWRTAFTADTPRPSTLEFLGIANAEITAFLNGELLGCYPSRRLASTNQMPSFNAVFDIRKAVRPGVNQLAVHVHFHGRHNSGQPIYAGISHPVVVRRGKRKELPLATWQVSPVDFRKWSVAELDAGPALDSRAWTEVDLNRPNLHCGPAGLPHHHEVRWYRRQVRIPAALRGKPLFLECPPVEEAWAFADGQRLGRTLSATSTTFDLTPVATQGKLDIAIGVRHNWHFWIDRFGLTGAPRLVAPGQILDGAWHLRGRPLAQPEPWNALQRTAWQPAPAAVAGARRLCVRCPVRVSVPTGCSAPLFVELDGWQSRVVLYWNGKPLGLYSEVGPQKRFYIPEHLVQPENTVHLMVDGYRGPAVLGTIAAGFYFQNRQVTLTLT